MVPPMPASTQFRRNRANMLLKLFPGRDGSGGMTANCQAYMTPPSSEVSRKTLRQPSRWPR